ncbi:YlbF family regulator [Verrucomicrobiota bacterium sgz303538]
MDTITKESGIIQRTQDLCQAIVEQADFQSLKEKLDTFMADELLKFQFQQVNDLGNLLQMKQSQGMELKPEEIEQFEKLREEVLGNPIAQGFLDAQQQMQQLHQMVGRFLDKTFELGRRPEYDDVHDGSCGGCGCH